MYPKMHQMFLFLFHNTTLNIDSLCTLAFTLTFTFTFTFTFTAKLHLNTRKWPWQRPWWWPHSSTWEGKWWCVRSAEAKPLPRTDEPAPSGRSGICDHDSVHWTDEARAWGQRSLAPFNRPALLLLLCLPQGCGACPPGLLHARSRPSGAAHRPCETDGRKAREAYAEANSILRTSAGVESLESADPIDERKNWPETLRARV